MRKCWLALLLLPWATTASGQTRITGQGSISGSGTISVTPFVIPPLPSAGWTQLPNTTLAPNCPAGTGVGGSTLCQNVIAAWSGGALDTLRSRLILWGGGHTDYNGNEVYALDLNALTMSRLNNPSTPIGTCVAANADGTPNARHTYDTPAYIADQDRFYEFAGSLACAAGSGAADTWTLDMGSIAWLRADPTVGAPPAQVADYQNFGDMADFDPVTQQIFVTDNYNMFTFNVGTNTYTNIHGFNFVDYHLSAAIDYGRHFFFAFGNGNAKKMNIATGSGFPVSVIAATGCGTLVSAQYPGVAYDPVQKLIVGWAGNNNVYLYNPDTDSCTTVNPAGVAPGAQQTNGTFGRFRYVPSKGVFVLVNDWLQNAWTLRLTDAATAAQTDFSARCAAAGVLVCEGFDTATPFVPTGGNQGIHPSSSNGSVMTRDTTMMASGASSMHCVVPGQTGADACGSFWQLPGQTFGNNSHFYVQFRQKIDQNVLNMAPGLQAAGTYFKQDIIASTASTCANIELTTINWSGRGYPGMYSQCGADGFQVSLAGGDFLNEQGSLSTSRGDAYNQGFNCHYQTVNNNARSCFNYPAGVWVTYYWDIQIGTFGTASSNIKMFVAPPGQQYQEVVNIKNHTLFDNGAGTGYNLVDLLHYYTGRNSTVNYGPNGNVWYDELIISTQPIAVPNAAPALP